MPFRPADEILPLTPLSFEILLALLDGERHGYAILRVLQSRLSPTLPMRRRAGRLEQMYADASVAPDASTYVVLNSASSRCGTPRGIGADPERTNRSIRRAATSRTIDSCAAARSRIDWWIVGTAVYHVGSH